MPRVRNWDIALADAMGAELARPFEWGVADCATLMATSVRACLGDHPVLKELRRYRTKRGALRLLKTEGGLTAILERHFSPRAHAFAQTGDIGVVCNPDGSQAGVVVLDGVAVGKSETGVVRLPIRAVTAVFEV